VPEVVQEKEEVKPPTPVVEDKEEAGPVIENIKAEKLEGPKILGKIQLPIR
jgi:translation initiation factor IF-2